MNFSRVASDKPSMLSASRLTKRVKLFIFLAWQSGLVQYRLFMTEDLYHSGLVDDILGIRTYYEQQWLDRGLNIKYMKFRLQIGRAHV